MVVFFDSFLDETWGLEFKLLVCCQVMSCLFVPCNGDEVGILVREAWLTRMQL